MSAHPPYTTLDGYINVPIASVATQHALFRTIGREDWLDDPDFRSLHGLRTRRNEVNAALAEWASNRTSADCDDAMTAAGVPCAIYHLPNELMTHPHLVQRQAYTPVEFEGAKLQVLNPPFQFDGQAVRPAPFVSDKGGDTVAVLAAELRVERDAFDQLLEDGAFGAWQPGNAHG
jgi:crotonobetainyl-CoA:carnitine CoA-transferase CaiB-like acyl-CoA transferase